MLLSIIIPTKNEQNNIGRLIESIKSDCDYHQNRVEIIVVDHPESSDNTRALAQSFENVKVFTKGPERSTQRNYGASKASGDILMFLDADMEIPGNKKEKSGLLGEILNYYQNSHNQDNALIIPEQIPGHSLYARARNLEKTIYIGNAKISAARIYPTHMFRKIGGYNETMISAEDWELDRRFRQNGGVVGFSKNHILHNEEDLGFVKAIRKKIYYAKKLKEYKPGNQIELNPIYRIFVLVSKPKLILKHPIEFMYLLTLKFSEFGMGMWVYMKTKH